MILLRRPLTLIIFVGLIYAAPYFAYALYKQGLWGGVAISALVGMILLAGLVGAYGNREQGR